MMDTLLQKQPTVINRKEGLLVQDNVKQHT